MRHVAGDSLQQIKRAAQPIDCNFTWSSASDPKRKPILKTATPSNSDYPVETSGHCESMRYNWKNSPLQEVTDAFCPQQETLKRSGEIKDKPASASMDCTPEAPSTDFSDRGGEDEEEEEDEDLTIFFTPELFDDDSEQGPESPLQEEKAAPQSEEALQEVRQVPALDGPTSVSGSSESLEHSWEQKERQLEKEMEEEKEGQKSQLLSLFRRLSRSKQAVSSSPAGN